MKITAISTLPVDLVPRESSGVGSAAIAQASNQEKKVAAPQRPLQKENRSAEEIQQDLDVVNSQLKIMNRAIEFSVDKGSEDIVIKVVDKDSGEVITQIPPEGVLRLREHLEEMSGLMIEEKV